MSDDLLKVLAAGRVGCPGVPVLLVVVAESRIDHEHVLIPRQHLEERSALEKARKRVHVMKILVQVINFFFMLNWLFLKGILNLFGQFSASWGPNSKAIFSQS